MDVLTNDESDAFFLGARRGVKVLDDVAGGQGANPLYGGYGRNAHIWDIQ